MLDCDLDQATLDLILELQLQDVQSVMKGKHRQDRAPPDAELAMEIYQSELQSLAGFLSDRAMCQSMARAVMLDGEAIAQHTSLEQQALRDREQALGQDMPPMDEGLRPLAMDMALDSTMLDKLQALYMDDKSSIFGDEVGESASWGATRAGSAATTASSSSSARASASANAILHRNCVACYSKVSFTEIARCPCSHEYCRTCIANLFSASIRDESLYPPRCCGQPIPLGLNQMFLSSKLVGEFRAKEIEYATPNRTYCYAPTCSTFVPPRFIQGDVATCVKCRRHTCVMCKGSAHEEDCPEDPATQELLRIAEDQGWQRCQGCRRMVELNTGCNHITCPCGSEFCYVCGVRWKNCACPQWDENRLLDRAVNIADRDAGEAAVEADHFARLVNVARQNLIENHECTHPTWRNRGGRNQCEECHDILQQFIYECRTCRILACRRCRFNRL